MHCIKTEVKGLLNPFFLIKNLDIKGFISDIIGKELEGTDYFLVSVDSNSSNNSFVFHIDGKEGVGIKTCSKLSRSVSQAFDEINLDEMPSFRYEISSPGADNPLIDKRQYNQHIGRDLLVKCEDESEIEGSLVSIDSDEIELQIPISKHKTETKYILFKNINYSKVKISFKRKKK